MMENFGLNTQRNIAQYGQAVVAVPYDQGGNFAYTIGNKERELPDFVIVKFGSPSLQCMILNAVAERLAGREFGGPVEEGELDINFTMPVRLRKASENVKSTLTVQAGQYYGNEEYEVFQVLLPDTEGKFPGDEGFDVKYNVELV